MRPVTALPGPRGWPLIGNVAQLDARRIHVALERWAQEFGPMYSIRLGTKRVVVVSDTEAIRQVLRERPDTFRRFKAIERVISDMKLGSLFSSEGESWKRQRAVYMKALNIHQTRPFFDQVQAITQRLRGLWLKAADAGTPVDAVADAMRYTLDVTTRFAYGYGANSLETHDDPIHRELAKILPMIARRASLPFRYWDWFKLKADRQLDDALDAVRGYVGGLLEETRARVATNPELQAQPTNLIEALLVARDDEGKPFSDADIFGNALGTLVAGEDTTAMTIAWMMYFLAENPAVQERLQHEVGAVLGGEPLWMRWEDGERLRWVDAVMSETFRLKPVAPLLFLCTKTEVELGGYRLPADTDLLLAVRMGASREPEFPDAGAFRPERWLEPQASFATRPPFVFGSGPRMCPGRNLAQMEIRAVGAMLAQNFTLKRVGEGPVTEDFAFTMAPGNLRIVLARR